MAMWVIVTEAETRSVSRRRRTWQIEAETIEDARHQAITKHYGVLGWNGSIWTTKTERIESGNA